MLIGITGGIGSGKSTICRALQKAGYPVYDTDSRAKEIIVHHPEVRRQMIALFGEDIYDEDVYFASKVAAQVFSDPAKLAALNAIVHPAVKKDLIDWKKSLAHPGGKDAEGGKGASIVESAILFSSGLHELCDSTVWVDAPLEERIARTIRRDGTDRARVEARMAAQKNEADRCDLVLVNSNRTSIGDLLHRLEAHIQSLHAVG